MVENEIKNSISVVWQDRAFNENFEQFDRNNHGDKNLLAITATKLNHPREIIYEVYCYVENYMYFWQEISRKRVVMRLVARR